MGNLIKSLILLFSLVFITTIAYAEAWNKTFVVGTASRESTAIMQVSSSSLGSISAPRMTTGQRTGISNPAEGLHVWDSTLHQEHAYSGSGGGWREYLFNGFDAAKIGSGWISNAEFNYLDGVTSDIQTQINAKFTLPGGGSLGKVLTADGSGGATWETNSDGGGIGSGTLDTQVVYGIGSGSGSGKATFTFTQTSNNLNVDGPITSSNLGHDPNNLLRDGPVSGGTLVGSGSGTGWQAVYSASGLNGSGINIDGGIGGTGAGSGTFAYEYCAASNTAYAGKSMQASAQVKSASTAINVCYQGSGSGASCTDYDGSNSWKNVVAYGVADALGQMCIGVTSDSALAAGNDVYVDDLRVEELKPDVAIERGEQYDMSSYVSATNWTNVRSVAYFYKTKSGAWRMSFNFSGTKTTATVTSLELTVANVTFKNISNYRQPISCFAANLAADSNMGQGIVNAGASTMICYFSSNDPLSMSYSGDVELDSKPSFVTDIVSNEYLVGNAPDGYGVTFNLANCSPRSSSDTMATPTDADCAFSGLAAAAKVGPIIANGTANVIGFRVPLLKAGKYEVTYSGTMTGDLTAGNVCAFQLLAGSTVVGPTRSTISVTAQNDWAPGASRIIDFTADQANIDFTMQVQDLNGSAQECIIYGDALPDSFNITVKPISSVMVASLAETPKIFGTTGKQSIVFADVAPDETISGEVDNFLTSCTDADPADCSFTAGYWYAAPFCMAQGTYLEEIAQVRSNSSATTTTHVYVSRTGNNSPFAIMCIGSKN